METQKIVNLLNDSDSESSMELHSKFATRKWYIINDQNNGQYGRGNENDSTIKFETKVIKSNLCDYSDAYIYVTGDIKITGIAADTNVAFKNFAPFARCVTNIKEMNQFKRDESPMNNAENPLNVVLDNSTSFEYKASLLGKADDDDGNDRSLKKIVVPLKYLSNFLGR